MGSNWLKIGWTNLCIGPVWLVHLIWLIKPIYGQILMWLKSDQEAIKCKKNSTLNVANQTATRREKRKIKIWIFIFILFIFFSSLINLLAQGNQVSHLEIILCGYRGGVPAWGSLWFATTQYRSKEKTAKRCSRVIFLLYPLLLCFDTFNGCI